MSHSLREDIIERLANYVSNEHKDMIDSISSQKIKRYLRDKVFAEDYVQDHMRLNYDTDYMQTPSY